jgi:hypothetical protein
MSLLRAVVARAALDLRNHPMPASTNYLASSASCSLIPASDAQLIFYPATVAVDASTYHHEVLS